MAQEERPRTHRVTRGYALTLRGTGHARTDESLKVLEASMGAARDKQKRPVCPKRDLRALEEGGKEREKHPYTERMGGG